MKRFHDATKLDLWNTLLKVLNEDVSGKQNDLSVLNRIIKVTELVPFDVAATLFHSIIDKSLNVPLDEIRDGMYRVGWLPTEREGDMGEPYAYVLIKLAYDFNEQMMQEEPKKKADI